MRLQPLWPATVSAAKILGADKGWAKELWSVAAAQIRALDAGWEDKKDSGRVYGDKKRGVRELSTELPAELVEADDEAALDGNLKLGFLLRL